MAEEALELYSRLQLYIPNQDNKERDVQAKYSIQKTDSNVLTRDCQGYQKPQGSGVRVQEGRVGVGILYPHETLTLARGQGVCQGYVKGMYKEEILLFCNIFDQKSLVFLLQKIFLAFIKAYFMALEC